MNEPKSYVTTDQYGVMRVGETRVSLDSVLAGFEQGDTPETIHSNFPALSLEEVYGSIAFYLANRELVAEYLKRQDAEWARARAFAEQHSGPLLKRLRALKEGRRAATSQ